jgi:hypothetical protein
MHNIGTAHQGFGMLNSIVLFAASTLIVKALKSVVLHYFKGAHCERTY